MKIWYKIKAVFTQYRIIFHTVPDSLHDYAPLFTAQHTSFVHTSLRGQFLCWEILLNFICIFHIYIYIYTVYTGYKFNKYIVLQFGPVKIKVPNKLL